MAAEKVPGVIFPLAFRDVIEELDLNARGQLLTDAFAVACEGTEDTDPMGEGTEGVDSALYRVALKQLARIIKSHIDTYKQRSARNTENVNKRWHKDTETDTTENGGNTTEKSRNTKNSSRNTTEKSGMGSKKEEVRSKKEEVRSKKEEDEDEVRSKTASAAAEGIENYRSPKDGTGFRQLRDTMEGFFPDLKERREAEESGAETGPRVHDPPTAELAAAQRRLEELKQEKAK